MKGRRIWQAIPRDWAFWAFCVWLTLLATVAAVSAVSCSDGDQPAVTTQPEGAQPSTHTPVLINRLVRGIVHGYKPGIYKVYYGTAALCKLVEDYGPEKHCDPFGQLLQGDYVQIAGPALLLKGEGSEQWGWYWQAEVLQGGVYVEDEKVWVTDAAYLVYKSTVGPRSVPPFSADETVLLGANFKLHESPDGALKVGENGNVLYVYGSDYATVLTVPTLAADGRYWCEIETPSGLSGWVYCEFQKI